MKPWSWLAHGCQRFLYHEAARSISISPGRDANCRSLSHNLLGFPNNSPVPTYTPGWREALWELSVLPKNTTQWLQLGLEPRPLAPDMSELTMRVVQYRRTDKTCIMASSFLNDSYDLYGSWNNGLSCKVGGLYITRDTWGIYTQVHDPYTSHDSYRLWNNGLLVMHFVDCIILSLVWLQFLYMQFTNCRTHKQLFTTSMTYTAHMGHTVEVEQLSY